jgi:hypothetical protein
MGSVEKLIKEEAKDACVRPHIRIRLSAINKVDNDSTEEDNDSKRNKTDNETGNGNKDTSIGGSGFSMPSPNNNCSSIDSAIGGGLLIDSRLSSDADDEDSDNNSTSGIGRLNNGHKILIEKEAEDTCMGVPIRIIKGSVPLGMIDGSVPLGIIEGSVPLRIIKGSVPLGIIEGSVPLVIIEGSVLL